MNRPMTPDSKSDLSLAPKRVYIETYGCQMNNHDSERLAGVQLS